MDKLLNRFLLKIKVADIEPFKDCYFEDLYNEKNLNKLNAKMHCNTLLSYQSYKDLFKCLERMKTDPNGFETILSFEYSNESIGFDNFINSIIEEERDYEEYFSSYQIDSSSKTIIFSYSNYEDDPSKVLKAEALIKEISKKINLTWKIAFVEKIESMDLYTDDEQAEENVDDAKEISNNPISTSSNDINDDEDYYNDDEMDEVMENIPNTDDYDSFQSSEEEYEEDNDFGLSDEDLKEAEERMQREYKESAQSAYEESERRNKEYEEKRKEMYTSYPAKLKDIDNLKRVIVTGKIFKREDRISKKGKQIVKIEYSDGTDSIPSTIFESKKFDCVFLSKLKVGTNIRVRGSVETDDFSHQLVIHPDDIKILPPDEPRVDPSPDKRVELHLHTIMSAMDGLATITDYAKLAKQFGMKALGVTDHGVVQSFPEAQKAEKATGVKMLYGCELYMVDSKLDIVINPRYDIKLTDADYVIFDLETTGLSSRYDRIIEFGATKYSHGQQYDSRDFFINPDRKVRDYIKNKTHITQEMVDGGMPIKQALQEILDYFGDSVIIDHNAAFDIGFLNEALKNNGLPEIKNPIIDTLVWSRYMFPKQRSHSLEATARTLGIEYDDTKVHRAIYDAEVLQEVFIGMLSKIVEENPLVTMKNLENLTSKDVILNAPHPKHVIAYAKNEQGLKDLYKIISMSSTEYLSDVPKTPRFLIEENRQNLLLGSGCFNGEIYENALTKSEDVLKKSMEWYDYIEVQPPACYSWLINDGQISSDEDVKKIIMDIIKAAKEMGKTVVATGDCHYLNKEDKIFRDVYIFAKGIKKARHPLNPFRRDKEQPYENPDQEFLSTQEMKDAFAFLGDEDLIDEIVVRNTNKIADMLEPLKPSKDKLYPPHIENCDNNLINLVYTTAKETYGDPIPAPIKERLDTELHGIGSNGYYVIYWIASVLVRKVNAAGHMVGSRGSVGSSLVATMSGITEVNPLPPYWLCQKCKHLEWADLKIADDGFDLPDKECPNCHIIMKKDGHNIPFETFLGFHADKVPDIDLNFPSDFQAEAHEMTRELMGEGNVFKAGTVQTTEEKNAIGYVKGYFEGKKIDPRTVRPAEIDRIAHGCIGVKRTTGQHPGGIIVIPSNMSVYDFTPYQFPANAKDASWKTTHYDFHAIHDNVLKFDELGHVDPYAVKMMSDMCGIDWKDVPMDDPEALSLFWSSKALHLKNNILHQKTGALGLPEFGTSLARRILDETKPRSFSDLVRISGLSHGTNVYQGNAQDLILSGKATLRDVIGCRDDIMTQLSQKWGIPADKAFKIMEYVRHGSYPKNDRPELGKEYIELMEKNNVPQTYIDSCKKIAYLFPKGHAVAYVTMAVRVAWFKVHKPAEYYATYFTLRCDAYDLKIMQKGQKAALNWLAAYNKKRENHIHTENKENSLVMTMNTLVEMTDRGLKLGKLSLTKSDAKTFKVDHETNEILPSFLAVDSLGEAVASKIEEERNKMPFKSVADFEKRTKVSSSISQTLRELGAYDDLPESEQMTLDEFM